MLMDRNRGWEQGRGNAVVKIPRGFGSISQNCLL